LAKRRRGVLRLAAEAFVAGLLPHKEGLAALVAMLQVLACTDMLLWLLSDCSSLWCNCTRHVHPSCARAVPSLSLQFSTYFCNLILSSFQLPQELSVVKWEQDAEAYTRAVNLLALFGKSPVSDGRPTNTLIVC
jgi:hypothetical protein